MESSKPDLVPPKQLRAGANWRILNRMYFPRLLRNAISEQYDCRCLNLTNIGGDCSHEEMFGRRVQLDFALEENGKLSGKFNVYADLNVEAARALAKTLEELVRRVEQM